MAPRSPRRQGAPSRARWWNESHDGANDIESHARTVGQLGLLLLQGWQIELRAYVFIDGEHVSAAIHKCGNLHSLHCRALNVTAPTKRKIITGDKFEFGIRETHGSKA
jgi:hypothetical protein